MSLDNRDSSGPATIQRLRASQFSVRPTAPPSDLMRALFIREPGLMLVLKICFLSCELQKDLQILLLLKD